jgi:hypothetical protein
MQDHHGSNYQTKGHVSPRGLTAIGVFLFFGATMASLAGTTLVWPGTALSKLWVLNAAAYRQLAPLGWRIGILFLGLGAALATAGVGWFRRSRWGWKLALVIIAIQVAGDLINLLRGDFVRGGTGVVIAGGLLLYLLRPNVRASFEKHIDPKQL